MLFSPPSLHAKGVYGKPFYSSFIHFSVPQAKTIVMNGKTAGQFNTSGKLCLLFCGASCMPHLEVDDQMLRTVYNVIAVRNIWCEVDDTDN